jgi:pSer/pThr/pTyr-binding forkhead associated (FHA) protein
MPLDKNTSRNIHMLTVTDKKDEFKLGRGHESEVRINDISVSRCHAIIKCQKDGFYIEDNLSKFGTIVLLKKHLRLVEDHTMAIQVGRSVVSFTIKNIDLDRKMREKLKREIIPLLSCNRPKKDQAQPASSNALEQIGEETTENQKQVQATN